ncbi:MAG: gamma-glutamyltransferase family protein, partial [Rhodospirillaceae bacterium]|nr:gamma-glutamyltransferase family protein [Rhodospirillaceae bacterium]
FNTAHFPGSFYPKKAALKSLSMEGRFSDDVVGDLRARGHDVSVGEDWSQGRVCAVTQDDGMLKAAASPRSKQPYAFGR